jgi:RND family efflux transporter MFP subunit
MHPTVVADKPGDCPICGMKLVPIEKAQTAAQPAAKYHCPMHPTVVQDKKGSCPICGMDLVPVENGKTSPAQKKTMYRSTMNVNEVSDKPGKDSMGMDMVAFEVTEAAPTMVPGLATVAITPEARQRMGLKLGPVQKRTLAGVVRTSAKIVADETRLYRVSVKFEGWVDKLFVAVTGQAVKKGDPLLTVYSPDLVSAQEEYLLAAGNESLQKSARRRLQLWDVTDEQMNRLAKDGKAEKTLTIYAPADGVVLERMVLPGQKIMMNDPLMIIGDLSSVWADADLYQSDLPFVKEGMPVEITAGGKKFSGKVSFITPTVDPMTRTLKARLEIPNPDRLLKPEMYATATLNYELGEKLAVPTAAVIFTGTRVVAFRDVGDGHLAPVELKLGSRSGDYYELLDGLKEGDQVVVSANFLVDSESSMKAALEALSSGTGGGHAGH